MYPLLVALFFIVQETPSGWHQDWKYRRTLSIANPSEDALETGYSMCLLIDPAALGLNEKCRKDFRDLTVVHAGKPVPLWVQPGSRPGTLALWFRTQRDLPGGANTPSYTLYYGNSSAPDRTVHPREIFDFYEDFSGSPEHIEIDSDVKSSLSDGRLIISDVAAEHSERAPAKLVLKHKPHGPGFSLSVDLEIAPEEGAIFSLLVACDMKEDVPEDPAVTKRVAELTDQLGDSDWEARESATKELITLGRAALPPLERATKSSDAEVKWRAEHALTQIRSAFPPQTIRASIRAGGGLRHATRSARIGKTRGDYPGALPLPARLTITINRDPDGEVEILWNGLRPDRGVLEGDLKEISIHLWKGVAAPLGRVAIDTVSIRRYRHEDEAPTLNLGAEETHR